MKCDVDIRKVLYVMSEKFREQLIVPVPQILKEVVEAAHAGSIFEIDSRSASTSRNRHGGDL